MFAHEAESVLAERLSKVGDVGAKRVEKRLTESEAVLTRRRDELLAALELRMSDAEAELRRRMATLEAQTEAERGILETRLQDLARRVDELVSEAENRLGATIRST